MKDPNRPWLPSESIGSSSRIEEHWIPKIGMEFNNTEEAWNFWMHYGAHMGFSVRKHWANKSKKDGTVTSTRFVCNKEGFRREDKRDHSTKHGRAETRTNCLVRMGIAYTKETGKYRVNDLVEEHNHQLHLPETIHMMSSQRKILQVQAAEVDLASESGIKSKATYELMSRHCGGRRSVGYTLEDQKNYLRSKRQRDLMYGEAVDKMSSSDRSWMYQRLNEHGQLNREFVKGLLTFISFACSQPSYMHGQKIRCPCKKCNNKVFHEVEMVKYHLTRYGFVTKYFQWKQHGEPSTAIDVTGPEFRDPNAEEPNATDKLFFDKLVNFANTELGHRCQKSLLFIIAGFLKTKLEGHMSELAYDALCGLTKEALPEGNTMANNFSSTMKLFDGLGLPVEAIDCCRLGCMLYWGEFSEAIECKHCGQPRYKNKKEPPSKPLIPFNQMYYFPLIPRLKRLYASSKTASSMRWHNEHEDEADAMCHPSDSEAWKHFNVMHPSFASEIRNVRLGLCIDEFYSSRETFSCWPIVVTPYNLPPSMCMKEPYMFLTAIVPRLPYSKLNFDVFLQPMIAELKQLWVQGVETFDVSLKQNFKMRAALMWTVSDFSAYSMLSGWNTTGKLACPYCMEHSQAFDLPNGKKVCWFDNHRKFLPLNHPYRHYKKRFRNNLSEMQVPPPIKSGAQILEEIDELGLLKDTDGDAAQVNKEICKICGWKKRSIFWDLPYWKTNLIRHNLDVINIEKKVLENLFNTLMNVRGKTRDDADAREDLKVLCNRRELERNPANNKYPTACYTLDESQKLVLCKWIKKMDFPDGYSLNRKLSPKLLRMSTHDCHIFMQRLLPVAFRELLPTYVWEAITELSMFFRSLTASIIKVEDMARLEAEIPLILCNLETIFVPGFFETVEHLPVHLPYEAKIAGPVQYRWLHPFKRSLRDLKKVVQDLSKLEDLRNAYLAREASLFCSQYFESFVDIHTPKSPSNNDETGRDGNHGNLSVFKFPGRLDGVPKTRTLSHEELSAAHWCMLCNCEEVQPYISMYKRWLKESNPDMGEAADFSEQLEKHFASWFETHVHENDIENSSICDISRQPSECVKSYPVCDINGYSFEIGSHSFAGSIMKSGVCIDDINGDCYGKLVEILEIAYPGSPENKTVLFKCEWFDPTPNLGIKFHKKYNLVEVNRKCRSEKADPFVLAIKTRQVCYVPYPSMGQDKSDWLVVCNVKPRTWLKQEKKWVLQDEGDAFQEKIDPFAVDITDNDEESVLLCDDSGELPAFSESEDKNGKKSEFDFYSSTDNEDGPEEEEEDDDD